MCPHFFCCCCCSFCIFVSFDLYIFRTDSFLFSCQPFSPCSLPPPLPFNSSSFLFRKGQASHVHQSAMAYQHALKLGTSSTIKAGPDNQIRGKGTEAGNRVRTVPAPTVRKSLKKTNIHSSPPSSPSNRVFKHCFCQLTQCSLQQAGGLSFCSQFPGSGSPTLTPPGSAPLSYPGEAQGPPDCCRQTMRRGRQDPFSCSNALRPSPPECHTHTNTHFSPKCAGLPGYRDCSPVVYSL